MLFVYFIVDDWSASIVMISFIYQNKLNNKKNNNNKINK